MDKRLIRKKKASIFNRNAQKWRQKLLPRLTKID